MVRQVNFDPNDLFANLGFNFNNIPFVPPPNDPILDVDEFVRRHLKDNTKANAGNDGLIKARIASVKGLLGRIASTMANGISSSAMINLFKNMASLNIALFAKSEIEGALDMSTDNPGLSGDVTSLNTQVTSQVGLAKMAVDSWRDILKGEREQYKAGQQQAKRL